MDLQEEKQLKTRKELRERFAQMENEQAKKQRTFQKSYFAYNPFSRKVGEAKVEKYVR